MVTAVVVLDSRLTIKYVNPAAEALLIKSFNKLYSLPITTVFYNSPIKKERLAHMVLQIHDELIFEPLEYFFNNDSTKSGYSLDIF